MNNINNNFGHRQFSGVGKHQPDLDTIAGDSSFQCNDHALYSVGTCHPRDSGDQHCGGSGETTRESEFSGIDCEDVGIEGVELVTSNVKKMLGSPSPDVDSNVITRFDQSLVRNSVSKLPDTIPNDHTLH